MQRLFKTCARIMGLILLATLCPVSVWAGTFGVNPVRIEMSPTRPNAVMQIENLSEDPVTVQAHIVVWSFQGPTDQYTDSDEILLNPPIFSLKPRQKQFLRLGLRHNNTSTMERTYRIILEQVPELPKPGFVGLNTVLRISVPIFAMPANKVAPRVTWSAQHTQAGVKIVGVNSGSAHLQIKHIELSDTETQTGHATRYVTEYLLPGQTKTWDFDGQQIFQSQQIAFKVATDAGEVHEALVPQRP